MSERPITHCEHGIDRAYRCIDCIEAERDHLRARVEELETENMKLRIGFSDMRGAARFQRSALKSLRASILALAERWEKVAAERRAADEKRWARRAEVDVAVYDSCATELRKLGEGAKE